MHREARTTLRTVTIEVDGKVTIDWEDGHQSRFPAIWLLHACDCSACGSAESAVRHVRLTDFPDRPIPVSARIGTNSELSIDWGSGHFSSFDPEWLRAHCLSNAERQKRRVRPVLWEPADIGDVPTLSYLDAATDKRAQLTMLETIRDIGFIRLTDIPPERDRTEEIAGLVGMLHMSNYGIYELESKPKPEIVGDMAVPLAPHTDEPYRYHPPAITFFHVLTACPSGGESTLVDSIRLAEDFRRENPKGFKILSTVPTPHHRTLQEGRIFRFSAPLIAIDRHGEVQGVRSLDRAMTPPALAVEEVEPYYDALRAWLTLLYDPDQSLVFKLEEGQMLVFNNQRLMHGRTEFDPNAGPRHVRSCHVDLDEFDSKLRSLYRERGDSRFYDLLPTGC